MGKPEDRTLNSAVSVPVDARPRFLWISTPAGTMRIRRMASPQLFTQINNFRQLGVLSAAGDWIRAETAGQMTEISKFLQRCLVRETEDVLAFPGHRGLQTVQTWAADRRREIAEAAAKFMEV